MFKSLALVTLFAFTAPAMACNTYGSVAEFSKCLTPKKLSKDTAEFLAIESKLGGEIYDLNHVKSFQVFSAELQNTLDPKHVNTVELNNLAKWSIKKLGVFSAQEYLEQEFGAVEMLRSAEKMNKAKLTEFLSTSFFETEDTDMSDWTAEQKAALVKRNALKAQAMKEIDALFFAEGSEVLVYELIDNNNENVADAQWVLIGKKNVVLMNRFWWL